MGKKVKKIITVSSIVIVSVIIAIYSFVLPIQDEKAIRRYTENVDKFENVHNYLAKNYELINCNKSIIGRKMHFYGCKLNKSQESNNNEIQIDDKLVLKQIEYILYDLDFKRIESIGDHTIFVLRDANNHFQAIEYYTHDLTQNKNLNSIKLKDNWYYRSHSTKSVDLKRPPDE